jgi:hypothetical protein
LISEKINFSSALRLKATVFSEQCSMAAVMAAAATLSGIG